jgi:SMC interacting uncharacterized protein involved in chromosome segregation
MISARRFTKDVVKKEKHMVTELMNGTMTRLSELSDEVNETLGEHQQMFFALELIIQEVQKKGTLVKEDNAYELACSAWGRVAAGPPDPGEYDD